MASALRPCPVENTRTRADSFGGTSTTLLAVSQQPGCDVPPDAAAPLDRPDAFEPRTWRNTDLASDVLLRTNLLTRKPLVEDKPLVSFA